MRALAILLVALWSLRRGRGGKGRSFLELWIDGEVSTLLAALTPKTGGAEGIRTPDPHNAIVVLYQLSYDPNQVCGK
jgi:hypothetical protein